MMNISYEDINDVNSLLKDRLSSILFKCYDNDEEVKTIFKEVSEQVKPQQLQFIGCSAFDHNLKIEYNLQGKPFNMIISTME